MAGHFYFLLTLLFYLSLMFFKPSSGHNDILSGFFVFGFYGIGFISSLMLTIKLVQIGGFDWVSNQSGIRNSIVNLGWICMTMATLICLDIKDTLHPGELNPFSQWLAINKGFIWMPLLMLVPCLFLLNTHLSAGISPYVYKMPLIIGFGMSVLIVLVIMFRGLKKIESLTEYNFG